MFLYLEIPLRLQVYYFRAGDTIKDENSSMPYTNVHKAEGDNANALLNPSSSSLGYGDGDGAVPPHQGAFESHSMYNSMVDPRRTRREEDEGHMNI